MAMPEYKKFPYRLEFPDSEESARSHQSLEDALQWARWRLYSVWRETSEHGAQGDYVTDAAAAVITNRNTGYRWILRRDEHRVEFQTSEMYENAVAHESIQVHLTIEEAEALARAANAEAIHDKRTKALVGQALDQIALLCRQVRERVRLGDTFIDAYTSTIPRKVIADPSTQAEAPAEQRADQPHSQYRSLGDPDNLTLKEAGEILGKARNTVYGWYRNGKFPPAVDVSPFVPGINKPVLVVPRYRLEAWQAGERMPEIFQAVFRSHGLRESPWVCYTRCRGANQADVDFWIARRRLKCGVSRDGKRIFGEGLEEGRVYELNSML
jgi:hypothetical protein